MIERHGLVVISELSRHFQIWAVPARADINELEKWNLLVRSLGGPIRKHDPSADAPSEVKESQHHEEKVKIGEVSAARVREGQTVLLDSGTTTLEVARALRRQKLGRVTVITNSLTIAWELSSVPEVGPSTPDILKAELNATMIRSAREVTVVTDSSKIGRSSLSTIAPYLISGFRDHSPPDLGQFPSVFGICAAETPSPSCHRRRATLRKRLILLNRRPLINYIAPMASVNRVITASGISVSHKHLLESKGAEVIVVGEAE